MNLYAVAVVMNTFFWQETKPFKLRDQNHLNYTFPIEVVMETGLDVTLWTIITDNNNNINLVYPINGN